MAAALQLHEDVANVLTRRDRMLAEQAVPGGPQRTDTRAEVQRLQQQHSLRLQQQQAVP